MPRKLSSEQAAVRRLIEEFDADIMIQLNPPFPREPRERVQMRSQVCNAINARYGDVVYELPDWASYKLDRNESVAVVHPSPPLDNRACRVLSWWLNKNGLGQVSHIPAVFHDTQYPTNRELDASHALLVAALDAADVECVLLHGAHALHAWRPDLTLEQTAGNVYLMSDRWWIVPVWHANAVMRQDGKPTALWTAHIERFTDFATSPTGFNALGHRCTAQDCREPFYSWDEDGVPWCSHHFDKGRAGAYRARQRRTKDTSVQGGLAI